MNTLQFYSVAVDPTTPTTAYGGSQDNGSDYVTNEVVYPLLAGDGATSAIDPNNPNNVYISNTQPTLEVSTNAGLTFNSITLPPGAAAKSGLFPFTVDSAGNIYYAGASNQLYFSSNQGAQGSWTPIGTAANGFSPAAGSVVTSIAVSPTDNNVVYVSSGAQIFVTTNAQAGAAVMWTAVNFPDPKKSVAGNDDKAPNLLAVDPSDKTGGTVYAVIDTFTGLTGGGSHHVYKFDRLRCHLDRHYRRSDGHARALGCRQL